jgi:hypothetical protein
LEDRGPTLGRRPQTHTRAPYRNRTGASPVPGANSATEQKGQTLPQSWSWGESNPRLDLAKIASSRWTTAPYPPRPDRPWRSGTRGSRTLIPALRPRCSPVELLPRLPFDRRPEGRRWNRRDSNPPPPRCKRGALPDELLPRTLAHTAPLEAAGAEGIEPPSPELETGILPLDDTPGRTTTTTAAAPPSVTAGAANGAPPKGIEPSSTAGQAARFTRCVRGQTHNHPHEGRRDDRRHVRESHPPHPVDSGAATLVASRGIYSHRQHRQHRQHRPPRPCAHEDHTLHITHHTGPLTTRYPRQDSNLHGYRLGSDCLSFRLRGHNQTSGWCTGIEPAKDRCTAGPLHQSGNTTKRPSSWRNFADPSGPRHDARLTSPAAHPSP